ncbi:hypothetical protein BHE74_00010431 [Ensete ventricosum]|uniref:Uncharacterized protein n=1 Tax=Ensete ventricosum TaxID=4639 RepID=A0A426YL91_ENSVE|nr:hypothetical protein B296_00008294 [Ensete ventricosum]RWW09143.1 hypothetical protein GW17_00027383 [Ensete ventricosum]RWW81198.1 hypothetical protein BHE74_00010431 [Ensete ventricosum]RZR78498.1 hypothetical protein BHM03_00003862 [Ensete ventricosum]
MLCGHRCTTSMNGGKEKFSNGALDKGGVGALELVAMDMKARGMYVCRTLSYKGTEFEVIEAPLEERMMVLSH